LLGASNVIAEPLFCPTFPFAEAHRREVGAHSPARDGGSFPGTVSGPLATADDRREGKGGNVTAAIQVSGSSGSQKSCSHERTDHPRTETMIDPVAIQSTDSSVFTVIAPLSFQP